MKLFRRMISFALTLSMCAALASCGQSSNTPANNNNPSTPAGSNAAGAGNNGQTYTLKIANTVSDVDPTNLAWNHFKQILEERTNGQIQVSIFSNGAIAASDRDVLDQVQSGNVQMGNTMPGLFADLSGIEDYYVYNMPYLINSEEELIKVCASDHFRDLDDQFRDKTGVRIYPDSAYVMGWYGFGSTKTQLKTLDDLKGLKLRINDVAQIIELANLLKLNPVFISFGEVYTACQQGLVDGLMTPTTLFWSNGFYEVISSVLITKHGGSFHQVIVNEQWYQSLPEDLRVILDECVLEMAKYEREAGATYLQECIDNMNSNGCNVYEISDEDSAYIKSVVEEQLYPNKDLALVEYDTIKKVQEIIAN